MRFARRFDQRLIGLLGRKRLPDDQALWIEPCSGVHTFGMRFAIDVVFLDRHDRIVRIVTGLPPRRWCGAAGAWVAIEFAAGASSRWSLTEGQRWPFDTGRTSGRLALP
ncbi:MAG: DUF192 domain-containing protein [Burkholderiaceae bacterium]